MKIGKFGIMVAAASLAIVQSTSATTRTPASAKLDDLSCKKKIIDWFQAGPDSMCGPGHMKPSDVTGPALVERGYSWQAHYICEGDDTHYIVTTDVNCDPSSFQKIELTGK
jgi:hypothetical protein